MIIRLESYTNEVVPGARSPQAESHSENQAGSAFDLAQTRYDYGLGNIVELSTAQLNVTAAQIAVTSAHYDYQTQRILVDYQTGVLH